MSNDSSSTSEIDPKYIEIFTKLDKNKDGYITIRELKEVIQCKSSINSENNTLNDDDKIRFDQYLEFLRSQETQLKLAFKQMDRNHDNKIDAKEIRETMMELGVQISMEEAMRLLDRMDLDHNLTIDYDEWRNFLWRSGPTNLKEIIQFWRRSCAIDIGEDMTIPDDFSVEEKLSGIAWKTLVAGGIAGCVSRTATAPLDRIKVTMQAHGAQAAKLGIVNTIKHMINEGGISALWRGNGVSCLKIGPESAIKFLAYEMYKKLVCQITENHSKDVTLVEKFTAGALAGATAQTLIFPMEVLKTRMCLRKSGQYSSIFDCARKVYINEGFPVFFRGYVPNLLGILPYAGIDLALFETFKNIYLKSVNESSSLNIPVYVSLVAGGTSSVCGQFATYPLALVRTKLQAAPLAKGVSMISVCKSIMKQEGFIGFYRGIGPNTLKVIPAVSISYAVFDQTRHLLGIG